MRKIVYPFLVVVFLFFILPASAFSLRPGDLDPTFNAPKGYVMKNVGLYSVQAHGTALQTDGKIVVVGELVNIGGMINILRYNVDGTLDRSFGKDGVVLINGVSGRSIAIQSDGKIVVVGTTGGNSIYADVLVARLNTDGSTDAGFGNNGIATYDGGDGENGLAVALQPDGKIVVTGGSDELTIADYPFVLRFNANGTLDTGFGKGGVFTYDFGQNDVLIRGVAVQTNGKIVIVAGDRWWNSRSLWVLRLKVNGILDGSFGANGCATYENPTDIVAASSVSIQKNGKILVVGTQYDVTNFQGRIMVLRFNIDGALDQSFGLHGRADFAKVEGHLTGISVSAQSDGRIVVLGSGYFSPDIFRFYVVRFNANGSLDKGFGNNGVFVHFASSDTFFSYDGGMFVQSDGRITVAISSSNGIPNSRNIDITVMKITPFGNLDATFGNKGIAIFRGRAGTSDYFTATAVQSDGKIVLAGLSSNGNKSVVKVHRYNTNGTFDISFGHNGIVTYDAAEYSNRVYALAMQSDGKIIVTGEHGPDVLLLRFNTDGSLDETFQNGSIKINSQHYFSYGRAITILPDGKLVVVGDDYSQGSNIFVLRCNSNGSLDTTFNGRGFVIFDGGNTDTGDAVTVHKDGRIVVAGTSHNGNDYDAVLLRYKANGTLDTLFGTGGIVRYDSGDYDIAQDVKIQPDEKIVALFHTNYSDNKLYRFDQYGALDKSFGVNGIAPGYGIGYRLLLRPDKKIVVIGKNWTNISSVGVSASRYNPDGLIDNTFGINGIALHQFGPDSSGAAVALQPDGKLVVAGSAWNVNNQSYDMLAIRLIDDVPPVPPTELSVSAVPLVGVTLTWKDNSDNETGFKIERKAGSCEANTEWKQIGSTAADKTSYTDTNVMVAFQHSYRVRAYNRAGSSTYSNCVSLPVVQ